MGLQLLSDTDLQSRFNDSEGVPCQELTLEQVLATRNDANQRLEAFLHDCKRYLRLHDAFVGPLKKDEDAQKKGEGEKKGRHDRVTDYVRGKIVVRTPQEVLSVLETLSNGHIDFMQAHGIMPVELTNFFEDPKDFTGYRALKYKLAVPVLEGRYHLVELQVVAEQIEQVYDETHPYKVRGETIHDRSARENRELTKAERREAAYSFAACRLINGRVARDAGYDVLLKPELRGKHSLPRHRELKLQGMVDDLHRMFGLDNL
jgi:hypothetical protein